LRMSGAALPDAQIRVVVVAFKLLEARAGLLAGCQGDARTRPRQPGGLACSTAPAGCDAWRCTAGGAGATIQSFTAVPLST